MNYDSADDVTKCFEEAYRAIRERIARGGPPWRGQGKCMCEACKEIQAGERLELNALIGGLGRG